MENACGRDDYHLGVARNRSTAGKLRHSASVLHRKQTVLKHYKVCVRFSRYGKRLCRVSTQSTNRLFPISLYNERMSHSP